MDSAWELRLSKEMNITMACESSSTREIKWFDKKVPGIPLADRYLTLFLEGV